MCIVTGLLVGGVFTHHVTTLTGSTVTLDCTAPPSSSETELSEWRFYGGAEPGDVKQIYFQPPFSLNANDFPPDRYHQLDTYGLEVSGVSWKDGGIYECRFIRGDKRTQFPVIVIGQLLLLLNIQLHFTCYTYSYSS